ncbi:S-formylglutathione hydrolase [Alteromonas sp. 5E99-2]|uniref:S-formylglutathione hydrolase n=1 Tax=Alteromonas sp. 5E99-2 TaxID=2817683 RepID=UPI00325BA2EA
MIKIISQVRANGGTQYVVEHPSKVTGTTMTFSAFVPNHQAGTKLPVLWYLSGLTCTHANVTEKGDFRQACAKHGIIFIAPDTSPRGDEVPDDKDGNYDFGLGAGFYVNATEPPFNQHYHMRDYIEKELPEVVAQTFPVDLKRQSITGHSMGGHGALTIALRNPEQFKSVSAFAPIVAPMQCSWGQKALSGYLGTNPEIWREYDTCALIEDGAKVPDILVDQGTADNFLAEQLGTEHLRTVCENTNQTATIRMQEGYDHSYYFIATFMPEHIAWHADKLSG